MDAMDYWRLCDELNVVQAALLIAGEDPLWAGYIENKKVEDRPMGYEAAKTALSHALMRYAEYCSEVDRATDHPSDFPYIPDPDNLKQLLSRSIQGRLFPLYETDINGNTLGPINASIDIMRSTIQVDSLKTWLRARGFSSGFFFPVADDTPNYLDPENPRYAPKLAAAVRAWQAVTDPGGKSPKKALDKWLRENAAQFGLTDEEGNPVNQAIEDCSKIANWNPAGGAPKTPSS